MVGAPRLFCNRNRDPSGGRGVGLVTETVARRAVTRTRNEHIDNDFVLSGGLAEFPMAFGNDNKGSWFRNGTVSGPGGIRVTGSSRTLSLQGDNTYSGGSVIDATGNAGLLIASYTALGTGDLTASQNQLTSGGGGFMAGIDLPGN